MKKLLFGLIATVMFSAAGNAQSFDQSVAIITKDRVVVKNLCGGELSAKSLELKSFDKDLKLPVTISIEDACFSDNGLGYDLKAGDGIYTSNGLYPAPKSPKGYIVTLEGFKYQKELDAYTGGSATGKISFSVKCSSHSFYGFTYVTCEISISGSF